MKEDDMHVDKRKTCCLSMTEAVVLHASNLWFLHAGYIFPKNKHKNKLAHYVLHSYSSKYV